MALTVINTLSACLFDFRVRRINPGTFGTVFTSRCSGHSRSSMLLPCCISDSTSATHSSSLTFEVSKCRFYSSQSSVSEMRSGALSLSVWTGWRVILRIWWRFNIGVCPPGRSFADKGGGKADLSDNWNEAAQSGWKSDQDALTISSVSEIYPTGVFCLYWARDYSWVARRCWLRCHISEKSWTLVIICNVLSSASYFISESLSVFVVSNSGSLPAKIPLLAREHSLIMTFLRMVSPVVYVCLQPMTCQQWEILASTPTPCGMIANMSRSALEQLASFECVISCWHHQSVMSSNQNVLAISIGLEW